MKTKVIFPLIALGVLLTAVVYFLLNPSYEKSFEAKYYYEIGEYEKAYTLANEAFGLDVYNRMASTIMAQSKTSLKYTKYIKEAKAYMKQINAIASQESISDADRARIKMMSEIVTDSYVKLAPSIVTNKILIQEAAKYHDDFKSLLEKVTQ